VMPLKGSWAVTNNQLCVTASVPGIGDNPCSYVAILLDDIALFGLDGKIRGKGMKLALGRSLEQ